MIELVELLVVVVMAEHVHGARERQRQRAQVLAQGQVAGLPGNLGRQQPARIGMLQQNAHRLAPHHRFQLHRRQSINKLRVVGNEASTDLNGGDGGAGHAMIVPDAEQQRFGQEPAFQNPPDAFPRQRQGSHGLTP